MTIVLQITIRATGWNVRLDLGPVRLLLR